MKTYSEALSYLFSRLPMFQRIGAAAYKNDLSKTIELCRRLGNPENTFKSIHVAGTNGKGSVASALASIFAEAGYKTGLFTSPHLKDFRERIRINGAMIAEEEVLKFLNKNPNLIEELSPSFFELTCAMAFQHFSQNEVDIAVLETGMGGRLDSTNVVIPELSIITSVAMDHEAFLGDSLGKIALEKGGIIKKGVPVVVSENEEIVVKVLQSIAVERHSPFYALSPDEADLASDLSGAYQAENMRSVLKAVQVLRGLGWELPQKAVEVGALKISVNTGLRGRWEKIHEQPLGLVDVGHNVEGVMEVVKMLSRLDYRELHMVWGMVADKDARAILGLLPKAAKYYWCRPDVPRGKDAASLAAEADAQGLQGEVYPSVQTAWKAAMQQADAADVVFGGGSVFVVAELI